MAEIPAQRLNAPITETENEIVKRYDRQRRLSLLSLLGAVFGGAIGVLFILVLALIIISGQHGETQIVEITGVAFNALVFISVVYFARKQRVELASTLFAIGSGVIPNINVLSSAAAGGANPFNVVFLMGAIVIVSLAGRPWMVICTALFSSFTTVYMALLAPPPTGVPSQVALHTYLVAEAGNNVPVLFVAYWGMTFLLLAQWRSYQHLLLDLADQRVQVERARQLDEIKDQFIRGVNHELRTPIMTILGYIDLLSVAENRKTPEKVERYVQRAERAGQSLRRLLAGILDTRRLSTTNEEINPESVSIMASLEEVIPLIPADLENGNTIERALRVHMPPELRVWAEPLKLQQILINLLSNAVKYSQAGSPVDIDAHVALVTDPMQQRRRQRNASQQQMIEIAIRDYGLGIPVNQQPLLFQRFMRLPRELESNVMGTGLGLYLCRSLAERMGGSIIVESSGVAGEGSTFIVHLPMPAATTDGPTPSQIPVFVERRTGPLSGEPAIPLGD